MVSRQKPKKAVESRFPKNLTLDSWNDFLRDTFQWGDVEKTLLLNKKAYDNIVRLLDLYSYRIGNLWKESPSGGSILTAFGTLNLVISPQLDREFSLVANVDSVELVCILDRSGSMSSTIDEAIGGINAFLEAQAKLPGEAFVTIRMFDDQYENLCTHRPIKEVKPFNRETYVPRGMTALLDAIGKTIEQIDLLDEMDMFPEKVIFMIVTDGQENASHKFNLHGIKELITNRRASGWEFVFCGANIDTFQVASQFGFLLQNTYSYSPQTAGETTNMYAHSNAMCAQLRGGNTGNTSGQQQDAGSQVPSGQ